MSPDSLRGSGIMLLGRPLAESKEALMKQAEEVDEWLVAYATSQDSGTWALHKHEAMAFIAEKLREKRELLTQAIAEEEQR